MPLSHRLVGAHNPDTPGVTLAHAHGYDRFTGAFFLGRRNRVYNRLAQLTGVKPGGRVLDVGCGTGYLARRLARRVAPGGTVVGVDASAAMIAWARQNAAPGCVFEVAVAERLDFPDGEFDAVTNSLMLHHLPAELHRQVLAEMYRVLRPGGVLVAADFRPPKSAFGKHLVSAVTGPGMASNAIDQLPPNVRAAGFAKVEVGVLRPWITYVRAVRE